jgi:hypothetical protein
VLRISQIQNLPFVEHLHHVSLKQVVVRLLIVPVGLQLLLQEDKLKQHKISMWDGQRQFVLNALTVQVDLSNMIIGR